MSNSTLTKSSGDESTPNSNSDSLSPPKSDNSSPPSEKEKSSSSSEDGKSSPPSDKDKSSSRSEDDKSSPPSKEDKSSSPSEDDKPSPPSEKDKSSSPSEDDKSSPPPEDDKSSSPPPPPSDDSESQPPPSPPSSENYPTPLFSPPPPPTESDESTSPPSPSLSSSSPPSPSNEASPPPPSSSGTSISPPSPSELSPPPTDASSSKLVPLPPVSFIPPFPPSSQSNVVIPLSPGSKWPSLSDSKDFLSSHNKDPGSIQVPPIPNTNTEVTPVKSSPSSNSESTTSPSGETDSSSSRSSSMGSSKAPSHSSTGPIVSVTFAAALLVLVAVLFVVVKRKRRVQALEYRAPPGGSARSDGYYRKHAKVMANTSHSSSYYASQQMPSNSSGIMSDSNGGYGYYPGTQNSNALKPCFSYEEMAEVTNDFSQENLIGQGGFGCVYKGILPDGRQVAVKELKAGSGQGEREFRAEVDIISIVHHRHLVSLVGYCIAEYHRLLVYEFVPNDTLEHHLHDKGVHVMEWSKRVKVAIGAARGLAYLHEDCHPRIIHRDIKSANILLDNTFEAKVADFGLAKLSNDTHTHISTRVMGTFGYMAPEYASTGKLTDRSDVYSFGVVLLELITGRKPVDSTQPLGDESLVEWARPLLIDALESGNCEELVDPRLENNFHKAEMFAMIDAAAACVRHSAPKRPPMVKVARALDSGGEISDLTNGVKYGQSQAFNSDQYSVDIQKFRGMVFTSESSVHAPDSREYEKTPNSREHLLQWPVDQSSHESETCAIYNKEGDGGGTRIPSL